VNKVLSFRRKRLLGFLENFNFLFSNECKNQLIKFVE
jgi:hypothetical protein